MVAVFCSSVAALYTTLQVEPAPLVALFVGFGPIIAVILWMQRDSERTGVAAVHDLGFLHWLTWPVALPWYAAKTRGRAGWRLFLGCLA
jgi:hypothetical protein